VSKPGNLPRRKRTCRTPQPRLRRQPMQGGSFYPKPGGSITRNRAVPFCGGLGGRLEAGAHGCELWPRRWAYSALNRRLLRSPRPALGFFECAAWTTSRNSVTTAAGAGSWTSVAADVGALAGGHRKVLLERPAGAQRWTPCASECDAVSAARKGWRSSPYRRRGSGALRRTLARAPSGALLNQHYPEVDLSFLHRQGNRPEASKVSTSSCTRLACSMPTLYVRVPQSSALSPTGP
jgi:hypothetical protein